MSFKKIIDSLWTFEMMTLCLSHIENEKYGFKKYVIVILKLKKNICNHKMNNLIVRCIENFPIYIFSYLKIKLVIFVIFYN
jgi:hypothetical protein